MSKLSYEDKIEIYKDKKNGMSIKDISQKYKVNTTGIKYLIRLIDKHGFDILRTTKNKYYSPKQKERIINRILLYNESITMVSIEEGLYSSGVLVNWIQKYKENGYNIVERKRGLSAMPKVTKKKDSETDNEKIKKLDELILAIDDYIHYYNYDRIKVKLKGLPPINYRLQSSN